ncbi:MAG: hypothetical protein U0183_01385 [Polyangiaceae bacterium]
MKTIVTAPSGLCIGWRPARVRSRIWSRAKPSTAEPTRTTDVSSGPR